METSANARSAAWRWRRSPHADLVTLLSANLFVGVWRGAGGVWDGGLQRLLADNRVFLRALHVP